MAALTSCRCTQPGVRPWFSPIIDRSWRVTAGGEQGVGRHGEDGVRDVQPRIVAAEGASRSEPDLSPGQGSQAAGQGRGNATPPHIAPYAAAMVSMRPTCHGSNRAGS